MNKYSVIIPTMWKDSSIFELLNEFYLCELVSEVILINNNRKDTPNFTKHKKLLYIEPYENIFVNPAWNMGVSIASNQHVTIVNDDVLFDVNQYFNFMNMAKEYVEAGYVGSHSKNYEISELEDTTIEDYDNKTNMGGWGCLFSFNKKNWIPIPSQLKIWYGDNWIHLTNRMIFQLNGFPIKTKMSVSSDLKEVRNVRDNDTLEWNKLIVK
jgi:GT2 family glycosyltransferase